MAKAGEQFQKALLLLDFGQTNRGEDTLRLAIGLADQQGDNLTRVRAFCCLGELLCELGRVTEGIHHLECVASLSDMDLLAAEINRARKLLHQFEAK